jgi:deoxyuridine 5'-triphosphate nucleotidohydrolase
LRRVPVSVSGGSNESCGSPRFPATSLTPAAKHSIDTGAGVIDVDYRGPIKVILFNFSDSDFASECMKWLHFSCTSESQLISVSAGDRIAQLILEEVRMAPAVEVDDLDVTERGEGGFGSTGGFGVPPAAPAAQ